MRAQPTLRLRFRASPKPGDAILLRIARVHPDHSPDTSVLFAADAKGRPCLVVQRYHAPVSCKGSLDQEQILLHCGELRVVQLASVQVQRLDLSVQPNNLASRLHRGPPPQRVARLVSLPLDEDGFGEGDAVADGKHLIEHISAGARCGVLCRP